MASEGVISFSAASIVEDVMKKHGPCLYDVMASRKAEQAATRRNEAASWLRKILGSACSRDLPESLSEEDFRLGLRSGYILCNAMNEVQPGAIPRVVEISGDSVSSQEGTPLSSYQHFENIRNFLHVSQELGLPFFVPSDLEKGGKTGRVVASVLALKSYSEWKQSGGSGSWKYNGYVKSANSGKLVRKNLEPFTNSLPRDSSVNDRLQDFLSMEQQSLNGNSPCKPATMIIPQSLKIFVQEFLADKKPEEIPILVEYMLSNVIEELEHRMAGQDENDKKISSDVVDSNKGTAKGKEEIVDKIALSKELKFPRGEPIHKLEKQRLIIEQQERDIQELKETLCTTKTGMQLMQKRCSEELSTLGKHVQSFAHAASGYHKVLAENRKLYNQVQDLKGTIRVYCRVRPFLPGQSSITSTTGDIDDGNISILTPPKYGKEGRRSFTFNKVFGPSATQEEVFADTQPLIRSVLDGYNVCIFAYGQTGSGKTYTMAGPKHITPEGQGVNYRALNDLFSLSEERKKETSYEISVQMIEIYNEQVRDLLCSDGNKKVEIHNGAQKGLNVPDATLVSVSSPLDVIKLMNLGHRNRAVSATAMNDRSSRSHSCLTVHVKGKELTSSAIIRGCIHLVDLAGSERVDKSEVVGERLKEAQHINKSLAALGDVIAALSQKGSHVPYRNSKLTQLLQDSLGGQAKTLMFVHISPEADAVGETISTLKFAERVSTVELGTARSNKENADIKELKEQIACLKEALTKKNGVAEHQCNMPPSLDSHRKRGLASSIVHPNRQRGGNISAGLARQPMEDVGNFEKKPTLKLNVSDGLTVAKDSNSWSKGDKKGGDTEASQEAWVDKAVVGNKVEMKDDVLLKDWHGESPQMHDFIYASEYNEELEMYKTRSESVTATTDDSDEFDVATSDSSEAEILWQFSQEPSKSAPAASGNGTRTRIPRAKSLTSSPDVRMPKQTAGPFPSRKVPSLGPMRKPIRAGRQSSDSCRRPSSITKSKVRT